MIFLRLTPRDNEVQLPKSAVHGASLAHRVRAILKGACTEVQVVTGVRIVDAIGDIVQNFFRDKADLFGLDEHCGGLVETLERIFRLHCESLSVGVFSNTVPL